MWFPEEATLIGALGLGAGVIILVLALLFFDIKDGVKGKESFTGNVFDFFVRMAGMNFWHTRVALIVLILFVVMLLAILIVIFHINIVPTA